MATICGFERCKIADRPLASIGERFAGFLRWMEDSSTLVCRFEDLVGPRGCGDIEKQLVEIRRIGDFIDRFVPPEQVQRIAQKMYSKGTLTYRKGRAGDWRNHFTENHRRVFKEVAGDILIRIGYEKNSDW